MAPLSYHRHRFPPEIIQHAIWLYLRFTLSYRDVEELLAERGLDVSYETVRLVLKAGEIVLSRPQHKVSSPDPEYVLKKRRSKKRSSTQNRSPPNSAAAD